MGIEGYLLIAIAPGIFWLWLFARLDIYHKAPRRLIALTFGLGALSTIPAGIIEALTLDESVLSPDAALASVAMAMLFVVGPVEEASKFAAVRLGVFRSRYFEEPMDGLVYAAAASLGFASLENLVYVLTLGPEVMLGRAPLSTVAHLVFGSVWGYGLGLHQQSGRRRSPLVWAGLAGAAVLHAGFNVSLFVFPPVAILLVIVGGVWAYRRFLWGQRGSPFRYRRSYPLVNCAACGELVFLPSHFCRFCGQPMGHQHASLVCGNCRHVNRPDALFCTGCGDRLLR